MSTQSLPAAGGVDFTQCERGARQLTIAVHTTDIEYRELQKAFTLLNKRLKPLEHFQPTPTEVSSISVPRRKTGKLIAAFIPGTVQGSLLPAVSQVSA